MATKKEVWKKEKDEMKFIGYLPTEDVVGYSEYSSKISEIITQLGGKADAFGVAGDGLSFNNDSLEINTDVMATKEWVQSQGYSSEQIVNQQIEEIQHNVDSLSTRVSSAETSINTLNSEIGNVYTKGETDNLVNQNIPVVGNRQAYGYWGGGTYSYCLVCKIKIATAWQSTDLRFEYGGNSGPLNTVVVYLSVADSLTSNYSFKIWSFANTNYKFWIKDMGNGEANVYCDITGTQGYLYITRVYGRMLDLHQVTMVMGNAESIPDGAVSTAPYLWADYAQSADNANKATTADTATKAETLYMPRKTGMNPDSMAGDLAVERTRVFETNAGTAIGGLGIEWWHVFTNASQDPDFATQFAIMMAYSNTPYFAYRSKQSGAWKDWAVAISDKTIGSQHVAEADSATSANSVNLPRTTDYDIGSLPQANKVAFNEINNGTAIGGLGWSWWHVLSAQGPDTDYATQLAVMMSEGGVPQLAFRNKLAKTWRDWAVAISDKTIGEQTVKSFTATEINHGCKFNGDLQSTSLTYSPKMTTIGGLPVSDGNSPEAEKTITGARTIRFGTSTFSLDFKRNAFMDYFFDHGYHIDNETEASTFYEDVGIVVYNLKTYLCTFKYYSNTGSTDFTAKQILTAGELDNLSLTGFDFADGEFTSKDTYSFKLPAKNGTIATLADIPNITQIKVENTLTSTSWVNALSAYQGKVLNERIKKGFQFVAKVDSTTWNIPYTANTRVCYLIIIAYKDSAGFQYVNGTNNPVSVVAINPLFTIDLTPGSSTLRGHGDITDFGAPSNPKVTFLSNTVAYIYKIWGSEY